MKILTPPLGLLEFLDRVGSTAKIYQMDEPIEQLSVALGARDEDILTTDLVLAPDRSPRIAVSPWNQTVALAVDERIASPMQVYLLTGYPAQWLPPFGLPHLLSTTICPTCLDSPCLYVRGGVANGWMALTPDELVSLTDFDHWSRVFAA